MLFLKTIHVLALGLWFGMSIFFSFPVALTLFHTFEEATQPRKERPSWFPIAGEFNQEPEKWTFTGDAPPPRQLFASREQLLKEQGVRAAGAAISPMFDWYFRLQAVCGMLAFLTALAWWKDRSARAHRWRVIVLGLALLTVAVGWPMERYVSHLRGERYRATNEVLEQAPHVLQASHDQALTLRAEFGRWHFYSLMLNFVTIGCVTVAMALAAQLPVVPAAAEKREPTRTGVLA
jgi:hypothetical protein